MQPGLNLFTNTGTFIKKITRANPGSPFDIATDSLGNLYETYLGDNKVQKFGPDGSSLILTWGGTGSGDGKFGDAQTQQGTGPYGIDVDHSTGKVYVMDHANHRIQVFGPDSVAPTVLSTSPANSDTSVSITPCVCVTFSEQMASSTITTSTVTLQEPNNNVVNAQVSSDPRTKVASLNPSVPLSYSTVYTGTVKSGPSGVKDLAGQALVSDYTWTFTTMAQPPASPDPHAFAGKWGVTGVGNAQFDLPSGVDIDSAGNIYVADADAGAGSGVNRIQKFKNDGTFITKWGSPGSGNGQFSGVYGLAVDSANNVYVTDIYNYRVQKFSSSGTYITQWGLKVVVMDSLSSLTESP